MSMLFPYSFDFADTCPRCGVIDDKEQGVSHICECGCKYYKALDEGHYVILFCRQCNVRAADASKGTTRASNEASAAHNENHGDARLERTEAGEVQELDGQPFGEELKATPADYLNVDMGGPPPAAFTDVFGFRYHVPWTLFSSVAGIRFFLRWFVSGGGLLQWPEHFMLFDPLNGRMDEDCWDDCVFPGMRIEAYRLDADDEPTSTQDPDQQSTATHRSALQQPTPLSANSMQEIVTAEKIALRSQSTSCHNRQPATKPLRVPCYMCMAHFENASELAQHISDHVWIACCFCSGLQPSSHGDMKNAHPTHSTCQKSKHVDHDSNCAACKTA